MRVTDTNGRKVKRHSATAAAPTTSAKINEKWSGRRRRHSRGCFWILFFVVALAVAARVAPCQTPSPAGREDQKKAAPNVYLKSSLDPAYFQKEVGFVNYVQDENEAQVVIEITSRPADGGEEFSLSFFGRKEFAGLDNTLKYLADMSKKPDEAKTDMARLLKLGLMRYVAKTPISGKVNVSFLDQVKPTSVVDKWNFWVFSLNADAFADGQETFKMSEIFGSFSASRVTPEWKIRLGLGTSNMKNSYAVGDYKYESTLSSQYLSGVAVRSISDHWSVGAFLAVNSSTYSNTKLSVSVAPAIEYDLFPYSQSTKKQLRLLYRLRFMTVGYHKETIYDKTKENLWSESLSAALELKQPWGTVSTSLEGSHYFHDLKKNRLTLDVELSLRIFKGLNFNVSGGGSRIHDQLSLEKGDISWEEVLLQRRQLETDYNYFFSLGLSYTFGSTSSHVVNPRFGAAGGTSINISF